MLHHSLSHLHHIHPHTSCTEPIGLSTIPLCLHHTISLFLHYFTIPSPLHHTHTDTHTHTHKFHSLFLYSSLILSFPLFQSSSLLLLLLLLSWHTLSLQLHDSYLLTTWFSLFPVFLINSFSPFTSFLIPPPLVGHLIGKSCHWVTLISVTCTLWPLYTFHSIYTSIKMHK